MSLPRDHRRYSNFCHSYDDSLIRYPWPVYSPFSHRNSKIHRKNRKSTKKSNIVKSDGKNFRKVNVSTSSMSVPNPHKSSVKTIWVRKDSFHLIPA